MRYAYMGISKRKIDGNNPKDKQMKETIKDQAGSPKAALE